MKKIKKLCSIILIISISIFPLSSSASSYTKDYKIMNNPTATKQQLKTWAKNNNASDLYLSLIDTAYDIAVKYEIDPTVLLAQTALETNFCKYGGVIDESYHNTAGIKTPKGGGNYDKNAHYKFDSWEHGFEAQAQHLRLYAGYCHHYREDCTHDCPKIYDPRHFKEISGRATHVSDLSGVWASDNSYGNKLNDMCENIVNTKTEGQEEIEKNVNTEEMSVIDKIKTRILGGRRKEKIEYIKRLLLDKKNKNSMKEYIKDKIK